MKKFRQIICVILAFCTAVTFGGCGNVAKNNDRIKIRFAFWEPGMGSVVEDAMNEVKDGYEKLHPEVEVEIIAQPVGVYQEWLKNQLAIDDAPEIVSNHTNMLKDLYVAGYLSEINDAYNQVTPYSDGKLWKDTFNDESMMRAHNSMQGSAYSSMYAIPFFDAGMAVYYNKDIYRELNLDIPKTWNEYIANCEVIKNAGITPIAMSSQGSSIDWIIRQVTVGLCGQRILSDEQLNFNGDCVITENEIVKAIDTGYFDFRTNTEYRQLYCDCLEMVKEYLNYCDTGNDYDELAAKMLFVSGDAAHLYSGSWDLREIRNSELNVGVFSFPEITTENGQWAGAGIQYNITQPIAVTKIKSQEKKAAAIDFLQYFTSNDVYKQFIEETYQLSVLKDVDSPDMLDGFVSEYGYPENGLFQFRSSRYAVNTQQTFVGLATEPDINVTDEMFEKFQESMRVRADELKSVYGWNEKNNYKIDELALVGGIFKPTKQ